MILVRCQLGDANTDLRLTLRAVFSPTRQETSLKAWWDAATAP